MPKNYNEDAQTIADKPKQKTKAIPLPVFGTLPNALAGTAQQSQKYPSVPAPIYSSKYKQPDYFNVPQSPLYKPQKPKFIPMPGGASYYQSPTFDQDKWNKMEYWNYLAGLGRNYNTEYYNGQMNVGLDEKINLLPDNFDLMYPENVVAMPTGTGEDEEQYSDDGGSGEIPFPEYSWGGGGYGNNDYWRDSGLINWRI